jgi:hypothetical protein
MGHVLLRDPLFFLGGLFLLLGMVTRFQFDRQARSWLSPLSPRDQATATSAIPERAASRVNTTAGLVLSSETRQISHATQSSRSACEAVQSTRSKTSSEPPSGTTSSPCEARHPRRRDDPPPVRRRQADVPATQRISG